MRGRRADRTPAGLSPRPPVSNRVPYQLGQPSVRREGLDPHAPCGARGSGGPRVCIPPPRLSPPQRLEWTARLEPALRPWQGHALPLSYSHVERKTEIEPATFCLGSRCSAAEPLPRGAPDQNRTHDLPRTEAALCHWSYRGNAPGARVEPACAESRTGRDGAPPRNGAVSRCRPGSPALQGQGHSRVRRRGRATRTWSRHPVPTRAIRRTKAEPQPCAAA